MSARQTQVAVALVVALLAFGSCRPAPGADTVGAAAVAENVAGAGALGDLRWYDASHRTLRPPGQSPLSPPAPPLSDPKSPRNWIWDPPDFSKNRSWNFSGLGGALANVLQIVAWVLLAVAALWFVIFVLRSYRDLELGKKPDSDTCSPDGNIDVEKLAELPFESPEARGDLLAQIRRNYEQGQFEDAIVLLFGYQLLWLDKSHLIRVLKGKTNRQYLREVSDHGQPQLSDLLTITMVTFEDYLFGDHSVTREAFESCWKQLDEFHSLVEATG
jgi:hypothetical protein